MKILVKCGGTLLDDPSSREQICQQLAVFSGQRTHQWVVVHGGGKQMTRYLTERGVASEFVDGLRVTTPDVLDAILKIFAGTVNKLFVSQLGKAGAKAVGLTGIDAGLALAELMDPRLGAVGRIRESDPALLDLLVYAGYLPVVACVAGGRQGEIYNVNADQMAVACAGAWRAEKVLFLTDVDGVLGPDGERQPVLTTAHAQAWIRDGVATGGMQAKLNAAIAALDAGVKEVRIARGLTPGVLERWLTGEPVGTSVVREG